MKTIFLILFHTLASRNILTTDVFKILSADKTIKLVVFVPYYKEDFLRQLYGRENVIFIGLDKKFLIGSGISQLFKWIIFALIPTYTIKLRLWEEVYKERSLKKRAKYFILRLISLMFSRSVIAYNFFRQADYFFANHQSLLPYFQKYQPDCVFVGDAFSDVDSVFVQAAKKMNIFSIGMVRSWDNTTTKGLMRAVPDKLITNNDLIKDEAVKFHGVKASSIFVGGIPQFDRFFRGVPVSREDFFIKIGIQPDKKLILLAPAGYLLSDTDWQICEILKKGIKDGRLPRSIHFLIRNHPADPASLDKFIPDENFTIEKPGVYFQKKYKATEVTDEDDKHLLNSLFHSEMVVHVNSTIGLDSLPFDKPQIKIEFDGWEKRPYLNSVRRYGDEDHMVKYLKTGASRIVESSDELFYWIDTYLQNPRLDSENRRVAMREQFCFLDGKSGERVGKFLLSQLV